MTSLAPEIPETLSPYWLRLYGHWVHLDGIKPEAETNSQRAFSDLVTVDGYRYGQRAPRGPRSWSLGYDGATAAATAALESAAYDNNYSDPAMRTLFLDQQDALVNMVDPDLNTQWSVVWDDSVSSITPNFAVINVGEAVDKPIWQPTYDLGSLAAGGAFTAGRAAYFPVRAGVTYTAVAWEVVEDAETLDYGLISVWNDGVLIDQSPVAVAGTGTPANPNLVSVTFTAAADDVYQVFLGKDSGYSYYMAGFMFYEGDCEPDYYRNGRRMPVAVSVQDPSYFNPIWPGDCNPCALPRETSTFLLQEVGPGTTDSTIYPAED